MNNIPKIKAGIVAVSRDCFPESLSVNRRKALVDAYKAKYDEADIYECPICIVESEIHMVQALEDIKEAGCNALVVYLGNFGPEISETLLAKHFDGPKMFIAAAEETGDNLIHRGMVSAIYQIIQLYECTAGFFGVAISIKLHKLMVAVEVSWFYPRRYISSFVV